MTELYTTLTNPPPGFSPVEAITPEQLDDVFACLVGDASDFRRRFAELLPRLAGIVATREKTFFLEQIGETVWHLGAPEFLEPLLADLLRACLHIVTELREEQLGHRSYAKKLERANRDMGLLADQLARLQESAGKEPDGQTLWSVRALTELVKFSALQVERIDHAHFPSVVVAFLLSEFFNYTGAAILKYEMAENHWSTRARMGIWDHIEDFDHLGAPSQAIRESGSELLVPFTMSGAPYLIVLSNTRQGGEFSRSEYSFFQLFAILIASAYERKALAKKVRDSEKKYRSLYENAVEGIFQTKPNGAIVAANPAMARILGYDSPGEMISAIRDVSTQLYADPERRKELIRELDKKDQVAGFEFEALCKGGRHVWLSIHVRAVREASGRISFFEGTLEDVTEKKLASDTLARAKEEAEATSRLKSDFLSLVSHELRTPMTSIFGFAKMIRKRLQNSILPALPEEEKASQAMAQVMKNIDIIVLEGERLSALINDVLDLTKLEAGKMEWKMGRVDLAGLVRHAAATLETFYADRPVEMILDIPEGMPQPVCDPDRMLQVLINLISNALKFTEQGSITCRARQEGELLRVSVIDTGIGIPEEDQLFIFDKFHQIGDTLTDRPTGTGLGLAICRQILQHHGGDIQVESNPGQGSAFTFHLPLEPKKSAEPSGD